MTKETLKLALEALETAWYHVGTFCPTDEAIDLYDDARAAIKEALAQSEVFSKQNYLNGYCVGQSDLLAEQAKQEPVAWMCKRDDGHFDLMTDQTCKKCFPVYTTPPQQEKNEFKPDWDEKLALTEEVIRLSKRIEELEAQPEPVKIAHKHEWFRTGEMKIGQMRCISCGTWGQDEIPQRTWVGLTDEEIDEIYEANHNQYGECESVNFGYERAIEARLKELNT